MIMNKYYKKLEFDQIINQLKDFAVNDVTKKVIDNLEYIGAKYYAEKMTCTIAEFKTLYGL